MDERSRRVARARLLRREGKTYDEIRAVIGPADDTTLRRWCRGIERPPETFRSCPKMELQRRCRELRRRGHTYAEIAELTGASPGSISLWVRGVVPLPRADAGERRLAALRASSAQRRRRAERRRVFETSLAAAQIGPVSDRELFLLGVALYWAEGSKSKTYALRERIVFVNSDPTMVELFMRWLRLIGVAPDDCAFRLQIHETASVLEAQKFWSALVGVPLDKMSKPTLKKHHPKTNRLNVGESYRGCLVVTVYRSAALYRRVAGWWEGIHAQATLGHRRAVDWGACPPWRDFAASRRKLEGPIPGCSVGRGDVTLNDGTT